MTQTEELTFEEVVRAGRVLFGPAFAAEADGWREALRATYRRRAMETHPDRARALDRGERELGREFRAVADAYRILSSLRAGPLPRVASRVAPPPRPASPAPARPGAARPTSSAAARPAWSATRPQPSAAEPRPGAPRVRVAVRPEELPRRRLRLAEYLYYAGRVRWTELADAIAWQRAQRPALGRIAVEFGFLSSDEVGVILERRREAGAIATPFGEFAVRNGYLTSFQLLAALGRQQRLQRPIGRFFVERGLVEADEIEAIRDRILRHNGRLGG